MKTKTLSILLAVTLICSLTACGGQPTDAAQESVSVAETAVPPVMTEDSAVEDSVEESALEATKSTLTKSERTAKKADKTEKKTETSAKPSAAPKTEQATAAATPAPTATPKPASSGKTGGSSGYTAPAADKTPSGGSAATTTPAPTATPKPATTPAPVHEHTWVEHYAEKQTLVSEGYYEDVYESVPVYETVPMYSNGLTAIDMGGLVEANKRAALEGLEHVSNVTVVSYYEDTLVDRVWHEPEYMTEYYIDYQYCACGATKK